MIATTVFVHVKDENIEDFISATIANHNGSVQEPGNLRFDVLQSKEDPSRFLLYEAYETEEAAAAHKKTPHYLKWRESVAPWMAEPRQGVQYNSLAP
ncbi:MAG: antibiotic biosynthesis monooxygenase [Actinobacteria bacterium]|nr:antibiotic biosynthesis monooxygenase [Actinomycetota bacterium]